MPACKNDHLISEIQLSDILHFLIFFTSLAKSSLLYIFCHIYIHHCIVFTARILTFLKL